MRVRSKFNHNKDIHHKKYASAKTGLPPGSIVYIGANPPEPSKIIVHTYDSQTYTNTYSFNSNTIHESLAAGNHIWVDISGLADVELISALCAQLGIHSLIIEDIVNTKQRPKLELLEHYTFIVFRLLYTESKTQLTYESEQFSMLSKKNLLITFRETERYSLASLYQRLGSELSMIRQQGSDYLAYLIMDNLVDNYFNFVEQSNQLLEEMENLLIINPEKIQLQEIYGIKRRTLTLRKTITPLRDIMHLLLHEQNDFINTNYRLYYYDLHDHIIRLLESIDLHHHMMSNMLDIYLSAQSNNLNKTMKILTQFASIFIPLTFIAGIYGMNFEYMPELKMRYGYPTVLFCMGLIVVGLLTYFKRKKMF